MAQANQFEPPKVKQFEPMTRAVKAPETVAGQMTGLLEQDSPLMQRAAYQGQSYANKRGLLDSSIGAEASQAAMIDRALPIAQQDASTYERQALTDQDIGREFKGKEIGQTYNLQTQAQDIGARSDLSSQENRQALERMGAEADIGTEAAARQQEYQLGRMEAEEAANSRIMELEAGINERLYGVQQEYAVALEGMRNQFGIQENLDTQMGAIYSDGLKSISNFLNDPDMSAAQQEVGLNTIIGNMQAGLNFLAGITSTAGTDSPYSETAATGATGSVAQPNVSPMVEQERVQAIDTELASLRERLRRINIRSSGDDQSTITQREISSINAQIDRLTGERGGA